MHVEATTSGPLDTDADTIVVAVFEAEDVAHDLPGAPLEELLSTGEAQRAFKRIAVTHAEGRRLILLGLGARAEFDAERARVAGAVAVTRAAELGAVVLCWEVPHHVQEAIVAGLVEGTLLRAYRFERYMPASEREDEPRQPQRLIISAHDDLRAPVRVAAILTAAQNHARDLANTPANDLTPAALAAYAIRLADEHEHLSVTVLGEDAIREAGMGAFAAVAQGSDQGARLIVLDYEGAGAETLPLALIGKAVTFDSGGLSLKPAAEMHEMKFDMCGGAAVIEAIAAIAELEVPLHVLGVVGATENLPSGSAVKPGDIVSALDGTTIEINNTDAEGRLVLADCLCYARRQGAERIVDVATLTGGVVVALGAVYAGVMSNDDAWAGQVERCAQRIGEPVWRLPLHPDYAAMIKGRFGQLTNLSERRREASAITAAELLHHFVGETPWAHLDIAGTAYNVRRAYLDKGGTGFGVRLLAELARELAAGEGG